MLIIVKLLGVYMAVMGAIILLRPRSMHRFLDFFMKGKRMYIAGILRIAVGVLFLFAVSESRLKGVFLVLGIMTLLGGILLFILKQQRIRAMVSWIEKRPAFFIRVWGVAALGVGALIMYSV